MAVWIALTIMSVHAKDYTEFIYDEAPFPSCHAATIVETKDGTLISAWFGGTDEGNPDVGIWSARKPRGADSWTAPELVYKEPDQPAWNPVLFRDADDQIWLFFKIGPSPMTWSGAHVQTDDDGKTWTEPVWMPAGILGPIRNKPIILSNGDILSGTSVESYKAWASWMEISQDNCKTWRRFGPLVFDDMEANRKGTIQPTMLEVEPGVVRAFMRTRGMGKIATSTSRDYGRTWSPITLTDLDHPGAGIDAVKLKDGRCVMIYNDAPRGRNPISLALSTDGGETWKKLFDIEVMEKNTFGELSYPNVIQAEDEAVHVVYTWHRRKLKHARIPIEDIEVP